MKEASKKILFLSDCDALGHVNRMLVIGRELQKRFSGTIEIAGDGRYKSLFLEAGFRFHQILSIDSLPIHNRVFGGKWSLREIPEMIREATNIFQRMIEADLELYRQIKPDILVSDGRGSVFISTEVSGLPSIWITNAMLSPYFKVKPGSSKSVPIFDKSPWLRTLSKLPGAVHLLSGFYWKRIRPFILRKLHNKVRKKFGLKPLINHQDIFSKFFAVLLSDLEIMAPTGKLPENFHYVGPLVGEPEMELPKALKDLQGIVYVSMGSTGNRNVFKPLMKAFWQMPEIPVVLTTGDLIEPDHLKSLPANVKVYKFLPGLELAKRSSLFICHGGLGTIYQALSQGVPIIGIPLNLQQEFTGIDRIEQLGAGIKLPFSQLTPVKIIGAIKEVLTNDKYRKEAKKASSLFVLDEAPKRAARIILDKLNESGH